MPVEESACVILVAHQFDVGPPGLSATNEVLRKPRRVKWLMANSDAG